MPRRMTVSFVAVRRLLPATQPRRGKTQQQIAKALDIPKQIVQSAGRLILVGSELLHELLFLVRSTSALFI
jgi:hypothetical protein